MAACARKRGGWSGRGQPAAPPAGHRLSGGRFSGREPEARKREAQESPGREDQSAESRTRRLGQHGRKTRPQTGRQGQLLAAAGPGSAAAGPPSQCLPACEPGGAGDTYY